MLPRISCFFAQERPSVFLLGFLQGVRRRKTKRLSRVCQGLESRVLLSFSNECSAAAGQQDAMEQIEAATVYTVTSAADSGAGSLREAITLANGNSGLDTIQFSIGSGLQTINLFSALPQITDPVVIDGTTQPGFTGTPIIELNGGNAAVGTDGLRVSAGGTTIRGLVINRFEGNAILITSGGKNLIAGNYLGTDPTGTSDLGNAGRGILIMSSNDNTVGGTGGSDGNIISGNGEEGIKVEGTLGGHVTGTVIQGNFIGPDSTGAAALPNDGGGIYLRFASSSTVGGLTSAARNVISGNKGPQTNGKGSGIDIIGDDNTIQGNFIGPNAAGTDLLGDSQTIGVDLSSADRTTIGGTAPGARNVIAVALGTQGIITSAGVFLSTSSTDNAIEGNYIGVDVTGTALVGSGGIGVEHRGGINRVGGPMPGAGNVIGGFRTGISADDGLLVQGNLIGTNATGTAALPNNWGINASGQNVTIGGTVPGSANLISGNTGYGIIAQGANPVTIQGNQIGTNAAGTASLPNDIGVYLIGTGHVVGGTAAGAGNLISGNAKDGIQIDGSISGGAHDVVVQGNRIGTDVTGTAKISNGEAGIFIKAGPGSTVNNSGAFIGGTAAGAGNVISGNTIGVKISGEGATDHTIQGNLIGTAANGLDKLGNSSHGIWITASSSGNSIGGMDSGAANSIAYNGGDGIFIDSGTTNTVSRNSIYENAGLGIDLGPDGVTSNDLGDGDPGANNLLNFPVLTVANSSLGTTHFEGTLNSLSNSNFLLEFFLNDQGDPSGSGEGKTFLGSTTVMTNGMGDGTFSFDLSVVLSEGQWITATSTDPAGSTSEFSTAIAATIPPTIDTLTPADNSLGVAVDSLLTIDFSENIQKGTGNLVIRRSADDSLFESIPVSSAQVTIADDVVTIDPSSDLAVATEYYVEIDAGTFEDLDGNAFAGIADKTTWSFFSEDPSPTLSLSISPAAISEQGGKATGTVTRSSPAIVAVTVDLLSSDPTEASVPNAVVILAGQMSATFPITGIDDAVVDGTQTVTVTAGATGHTNGTDTVDVTDNDIPTLTVTIDKTSISENGGIATGTVTRNTD
ncbi:MAG: Ig-like domain-containing protein, partial [Planctomycetaceae bacterium]|nr:Ig-like domain-containing protein [Planctomycetaceae bacterium]